MAFPSQSIKLVKASTQAVSRAHTGSTNLYATGATNFTWESWVKFTTFPSNAVHSLYGQSWATGGNLSILIQLDDNAGTKGIRLRIGSSGNQDYSAVVATLGTILTGTWYHLALVYTASTGVAEVFLNGVSKGTASTGVTSIFNGTDLVSIGAEGDLTSSNMDGQLSLTRFWRTTRTGANLIANWCTELGSTSNLGAEWTFDNTYNDNSGNSNTGTGANAPTFVADVTLTCSIVGGAFLLKMI